jgi:hypothetical protein
MGLATGLIMKGDDAGSDKANHPACLIIFPKMLELQRFFVNYAAAFFRFAAIRRSTSAT